MMDELEEIRRRKMQEYLAIQESQAQIENAQRIEAVAAEIKRLVSRILSAEAMQRLSNIRAIKPDLAYQIDMYLLQLYRAGQIKSIMSDAEFKSMLDKLIQKKESRIIRKSK